MWLDSPDLETVKQGIRFFGPIGGYLQQLSRPSRLRSTVIPQSQTEKLEGVSENQAEDKESLEIGSLESPVGSEIPTRQAHGVIQIAAVQLACGDYARWAKRGFPFQIAFLALKVTVLKSNPST